MIICKVCGKETSLPIKLEFLCLKCYQNQLKAKSQKPVKLPTFWRRPN